MEISLNSSRNILEESIIVNDSDLEEDITLDIFVRKLPKKPRLHKNPKIIMKQKQVVPRILLEKLSQNQLDKIKGLQKTSGRTNKRSSGGRRRSIYPPVSKKKPEKRKDSYEYKKNSQNINELEKPKDRLVNKFNRYKVWRSKNLNLVRKDYPCHYNEKLKIYRNRKNGLSVHSICSESIQLEKKKLPLDNSFEGKDFSKVKKWKRKFMRKMGLRKRASERFAKATLRAKKKSFSYLSFSEIDLK